MNNPNRGSNRKEKRMNETTRRSIQAQPRKNLSVMKRYTFTLTGMLALCLAVPAAFAAEPPSTATPAAKSGPAWGAADVQPTPENPVYFRWSQGYFPGAQPPTEFWDGTAAQVDREVEGKKGKVWDFTDTKSKRVSRNSNLPYHV